MPGRLIEHWLTTAYGGLRITVRLPGEFRSDAWPAAPAIAWAQAHAVEDSGKR